MPQSSSENREKAAMKPMKEEKSAKMSNTFVVIKFGRSNQQTWTLLSERDVKPWPMGNCSKLTGYLHPDGVRHIRATRKKLRCILPELDEMCRRFFNLPFTTPTTLTFTTILFVTVRHASQTSPDLLTLLRGRSIRRRTFSL